MAILNQLSGGIWHLWKETNWDGELRKSKGSTRQYRHAQRTHNAHTCSFIPPGAVWHFPSCPRQYRCSASHLSQSYCVKGMCVHVHERHPPANLIKAPPAFIFLSLWSLVPSFLRLVIPGLSNRGSRPAAEGRGNTGNDQCESTRDGPGDGQFPRWNQNTGVIGL